MHLVKMNLGEPDESGRRRPIEDPHTSFDMDIDEVIFAIGTSPNPLIFSTSDLASTSHGCVIIDEKGRTSLNHIYAGGDVVSGSATVILAMEAGRKAAKSILESINL